MVYAFGSSRGLVKIVKHGKNWAVYQIKRIEWWEKVFADPMRTTETKYKFVWEKKAIATHSYKPFEDGDVTDDPNTLIEDVKTWHPSKLCYTG